MSDDLEKRAAEHFFSLVQLLPDERARRLAAIPNDPPGLIAWIQTLLAAADANRDGFLERPAAGTNFSVSKAAEPDAHAQQTMTPAPEAIGHYKVIRLIAERDFTSVYLCRQEEPIHRVAAVKVLHSPLHRRELLKRFEGERQMVSSFQHPNIAQFYEAGATKSGTVFFSMEFIDGPAVTDFCLERSLPLRDRLQLFLQICEAIEHAHQRGVIHRDLKPANILVQRDDGTGSSRVKVIDFGVAKALNSDSHPNATVAGQLIGTFAYMSPEQLVGQPESVDTRADVFALGLILFEMLTGRAARDTRTVATGEATTNPLSGLAWTLNRRDADLDEDLTRIIVQSTEHHRDARYPSVAELRKDIECFLGNRPIAARRPSIVYRTRKFVQRHRVAVAASVVLLCAAVATVTMIWRARTQRLDLAVQLAEAWFEETRVMQSTIGEASLRGPALQRLSAQVAAFSQIAPEDPRIRSMQASSLTELGYAALDAADLDEAERAFHDALQIRRELAEAQPNSDQAQMQFSLATVRMGDVAGERGDVDGRLGWCLKALEIDEPLLQRNPTDTHALSNLGWSYDRLGNIAISQKNLREAEDYKRRAAEVFDRFAKLGPSAEALRGRATANLSLAEIYNIEERIDDATAHAALALSDARAAEGLSPSDRFVLQVLVYSEFRHADMCRKARKTDASLQVVLDAVKHAELLLSLSPNDPSLRRLLASALLTAGRYALECGRTDLVAPLAERAHQETLRSTNRIKADEHHQHMLEEAKRLIDAVRATPNTDRAGEHSAAISQTSYSPVPDATRAASMMPDR